MKNVGKMIRTLALAVLFSVMLTTVAFAAQSGSVWLSDVVTADRTSALIVTDTTVTDGLVKLAYDSSVLTYQDVEVAEEYVAMYSVNPDQDGIVLISWVAPKAYETDGSGIELIAVNFAGTANEDSVVLSGTVHGADGNEIAVGDVDTTELEESVAEAEEFNEADYTEESYKNLEDALTAAEAVLADATASQSEVDAANAALQAAIDALVKKQAGSEDETTAGDETSGSDEDGDDSNSGNTGNTGNTGSTSGSGSSADTGDHNNNTLFIVLAVAAVVAVVAVVILKSRRKEK